MAIARPGSFIYLAHPSTGSTATMSALRRIEGAFVAVDKRRGIGNHASLEEVRSVCGDRLTGTEVVFTAVRNPYDALASWFVRNQHHFQMRHLRRVLGRDPMIKEFLDMWFQLEKTRQGAPPWLRDGRMFYHGEAAREIVHQENLTVELNALLRKVPRSPGRVELNRENVTEGKDHWTSYYTDADYAYVNEHLRDEFVKFGYPFVWSNENFG